MDKIKNLLKKIAKYNYEIVIFIRGMSFMMLELLAARVMSPYYGSSNVIWTCIIGIVLFGSSLGNFAGGVLADKYDAKKVLRIDMVACALLIGVLPFVQDKVLAYNFEHLYSIIVSALVCTTELFILPTFAMGIVTPLVIKVKVQNIEKVGETSGRIYSVSTLGSIFGTFFGGFILIPSIGTIQMLFIIAALILISVLFIDTNLTRLVAYSAVTVALVILCGFYMFRNEENKKIVLTQNDNYTTSVSIDTQYSRVLVHNLGFNLENLEYPLDARVVDVGTASQSLIFLEEEYRTTAAFPYQEWIGKNIFKENYNFENVLCLGGGTFTLPREIMTNDNNLKFDIVEIDEGYKDIAYEYFYLDEFEKLVNKDEKRLNIFIDDARIYMNNNQKKYDVVINDTYLGFSIATMTTTVEMTEMVHDCLNDGGYYVANIYSSYGGENGKLLAAEMNTWKKVFKYVEAYPVVNANGPDLIQNIMLVASDDPIDFGEDAVSVDVDLSEAVLLTDDFAPTDRLLPMVTKEYR
jgi:spermidine synthase